jgi:hypothetical protein
MGRLSGRQEVAMADPKQAVSLLRIPVRHLREHGAQLVLTGAA